MPNNNDPIKINAMPSAPTDSRRSLKQKFERAVAAYQDKDYETATELFRDCLRNAPGEAVLWSRFASCLRQLGHIRGSLSAHRRALALDPNNAAMRTHYSNALCDAGRYAEAIKIRRALLDEDPSSRERVGLLAEALHCDRQQSAAVALLNDAEARIGIDPKHRLQRSIAKLALGDWRGGFEEFETRFFLESFVNDENIRWQRWEGDDLNGKSLLVLNEQGFGDAMFSARFFGELKDRGALVTVVLAKPLRRLMKGLGTIDVVRSRVDRHDVFDFYTYAMSIPFRLGFDGTHVPPPPRFELPKECTERASSIVGPYSDLFKIGMVWTGSAQNPINRSRATSPERFLQIADVPGVQLFSLFKGEQITELSSSGAEGVIVNASQTDADFADTAAVIDAMDLVITTDTAVAHLAGAMGKPTWLMLSRQGFWYWGYGESTPWYPSIRLYHQEKAGDWSSLFDRITGDLRTLLAR